MRKLLLSLVLTFWSVCSTGSPIVVASQFTTFTGNAPVIAIPAGALGDTLLAVVGLPCTANAGLATQVTGWSNLGNSAGTCGQVLLGRPSDGTETSVTIPLTATVSGVGLVLRVSGADILPPHGPVAGGAVTGSGTAPNAIPTSAVPGTSQDVLWLTFATAMKLPTLAPSGYTNTLSQDNPYLFMGHPADIALMLAQRSDTDSWPYQEDAGPWLLPAVSPWRAQTIGIR